MKQQRYSLSPETETRGIKRRSSDSEPTMLNTLASISVQQQQQHMAEKRRRDSEQLLFDKHTHMPPPDITDELLGHTTSDHNIVSKIIQPKAFIDDLHGGRLSAFFLLACMANNVMFSTHPAVERIGFVAAMRQLVDEAKVLAPAALEAPSVRNCQALLLLSMAYMHLGKLAVSSHYSSITLRILQQLGVCTMDNNDCGDDDGWLHASWLEREQVRRLVWGSFTVDTFLAMVQHTTPYVMVDLSGVNRPCAPNMWYVGNDNLDSLSLPPQATACYTRPRPGDSEYLTALRAAKVNGMSWSLNGNTVQLNFAVLGNAILRSISDPQLSHAHVDRLVIRASKSVSEWLAPVPLMPANPSLDELKLTLMMSSASLCLKSVITPYLFARCRPHSRTATESLEESSAPELRELNSEQGLDKILADYIKDACEHYEHAVQILQCKTEEDAMPPMFAAYSMTVCGGMLAACAHAAPTEQLHARFSKMVAFFVQNSRKCAERSLLFKHAQDEIVAVAEMASHLPRRLDKQKLLHIRDTLLPGSVEPAVNKRFDQFIAPLKSILKPAASLYDAPLSDSAKEEETRMKCPLSMGRRGFIPLTSNLCAIFEQALGRKPHRALSETSDESARSPTSPAAFSCESSSTTRKDESIKCSSSPGIDQPSKKSQQPRALPTHRLTFTAITSLMIGLTVATKDAAFFDFMPKTTDIGDEHPPHSAGASNLVNILN
ncbi:hypothetical protein LPJ79_003678 [Coemansia sp. RSA 1821]|nr:hypothetical protein LPJ79_003678 [Coemansia sp. RSA 1821]KAJ2669168.1 hypothetical protein IWW42_004779 [Coemansia sp. RSA 1085]